MKYNIRIADDVIKKCIVDYDIINVEGIRSSGKSSICINFSKTSFLLEEQNTKEDIFYKFESIYDFFNKQDYPLLIDEWQTEPFLYEKIMEYLNLRNNSAPFSSRILNSIQIQNNDSSKSYYKFILNNSFLRLDNIYDLNNERVYTLRVYPFSLYESLISNGRISLRNLVYEKDYSLDDINSNFNIAMLARIILKGGFFFTPNTSDFASKFFLEIYINNLLKVEAFKVDDVNRNCETFKQILKSYSKFIGTTSSHKKIRDDVLLNIKISDPTYYDYIKVLENIFVIDELPAWTPPIRSKTAIKSSSVRYLADPCIAASLLEINQENIFLQKNLFYSFFKNLVIRDLRAYASLHNAKLSHYQDRYDLECDVVLHYDDLNYALISIKLGLSEISCAAKKLLKLDKLIRANKLNPPTSLIIITNQEKAFKRQDGVCVIPIGCLRP